MNKKIFDFIDNSENLAIKIEEELCKYPALSPNSGGEGEFDKFIALEKILKELGINELKRIDIPDKRAKGGVRPNLIAELGAGKKSQTEKTGAAASIAGAAAETAAETGGGTETADGVFWIISHLDVVPPIDPQLWDTDPWQATVKDGKIYGRGTEDNQQGLTASIIAAAAFVQNGIKPARTLRLLFVSDEECGNDYGMIPLSKQNLIKKSDLVLVPDGGDELGETIEIAEKKLLWIKCRTIGKQTHGSRPAGGKNSFLAGSELAFRLHTELSEKFNALDELFDPPYSTFQPTKKEANVPNINTIPGQDVFYMDMRILPSYSVSDILEEVDKIKYRLEAKHGVKIEIEIIQHDESKATPADSPIVKVLSEKIREVLGIEPLIIGVGGGSVAAVLRNEGIDSVVWSPLDKMAHNINEYAVIKNIINSAKVMAAIAATA